MNPAFRFCCLLSLAWASSTVGDELPGGVDPSSPLLRAGCLDVTRAPYHADPTGAADATSAIQRAVDDARDHGLACFFPTGTYLVSDTISCEQKVEKLAVPRHVDGGTEHYWPVHRPIVVLGSTRGPRPVLRLSREAKGFDDPARPKVVFHIWAQTWFDAPGREEPVWGQEQPNISFNHTFRGLDIDVRGHAGAIGIRHSGSQGSTLQDVTILADGAYAGMSSCPGQGGGTHNVEVRGGRYGLLLEPSCRFPLLTTCTFRDQTEASIRYTRGGSQVPTLLVGCRFEPAGGTAIDLSTERAYAGVSLVDCAIDLRGGGVAVPTKRPENLFLENTFVRGATAVRTGGPPLPEPSRWTRIERYSAHADRAVNLIDGTLGPGELHDWTASGPPDLEALRNRHLAAGPSFEDHDAVNVRDSGAKGDGSTDDGPAFARAIAVSRKVFVPKGNYRLAGTLRLPAGTQLFGLSRSFAAIGDAGFRTPGGEPGPPLPDGTFTLVTDDDPAAAPGLWFLSVRGRVDWRCGRGTWMLGSGNLTFSGAGGGRLYGLTAMGRPLLLDGIRQSAAFYALNVERITSNPQSEIRGSSHVRVYYFKVEAGTIQRANAGDANTPCRIAGSHDIRIYCMYGNVRDLAGRPMLEVTDSRDVLVSQLAAFQPGGFPHLTETLGGTTRAIPSRLPCALYVRRAPGE